MTRAVSVFDLNLPPGVAFIRSLGRAGVPTVAYSSTRMAAGRFSRFAGAFRRCPPVYRSDEFIDWLTEQLAAGSIDLIAPTSDFVMFCVAAATNKLGGDAHDVGHPRPHDVWTCLFKDRFYPAMERAGFPAPEAATPTSIEQAMAVADRLGYPVVIKPRSHAGVGTRRGVVARSPAELEKCFDPYPIDEFQNSVLREEPDIALPIVQRYYELGTVDVISVTGCLGRDGEVLTLSHSRKVRQWPRRLGVGTLFEPSPPQPFTAAAVEAVRRVLGSGLFEFEVLVKPESGECWSVDLNPRGFGQMSLDMALGSDLPVWWYRSVTGEDRPVRGPRRQPPELWHAGVTSYLGLIVRMAGGPHRAAIAADAFHRITAPAVGAIHEWRDPLPGLRYAAEFFRHPRALLRQMVSDIEVVDATDSAS